MNLAAGSLEMITLTDKVEIVKIAIGNLEQHISLRSSAVSGSWLDSARLSGTIEY